MKFLRRLGKYLPAAALVAISLNAHAQTDDTTYRSGKYSFRAKYDTAGYFTRVIIKENGREIFRGKSDGRIFAAEIYDLDGDGRREFLINTYSGGAHCCTDLIAAGISNGKFTPLDTIHFGNAGSYEVKDINSDGKYEIIGYNDSFAYEFTNYAQSRFYIQIFGFGNGRFVNVTPKFPELVLQDIRELKEELAVDFLINGFQCPESDTSETFNTDAGAVKAILGPLAADYHSLGEVDTGYEYIDSVYKCPDAEKFKKILREEYKLTQQNH